MTAYKLRKPSIVFVDREAERDEITEKVLQRLPQSRIVYLDQSGDPISERGFFGDYGTLSASEIFNLGKDSLLLTRHKGSWLRSCPGTSNHVCCNLWTVDLGEGCPMDCTYCYLQTYLRRNPTNKIFTNIGDMVDEIKFRTQSEPNRLFRICTGEVIDSLVWDGLTDVSLSLIPVFAQLPNAILELKTKTNQIDNILSMRAEHRGSTVISWSVNAPSIVESDEAFTATLSERISAAGRAVEAGYRVGFHFDPIVHFDGWRDGYREVIQRIFSTVKPEEIAWISISSLRYQKGLQSVMQERFPNSRLPFGDQFVASDQKLRYIQPLRFQLLSFVWGELKRISPSLPVYMCMESGAGWRTIAGGAPAAGSELAEVFSRRGKLPIHGQMK